MGFSQNLFGAIANNFVPPVSTQADFIPTNSIGDTLDIKGADATWLGLRGVNMQYWAYVYCAPLASIIEKIADCDINGYPEVLKLSGDYTQSPVAKRLSGLISKPNAIQTWGQFRGEQVVYKKIFGYCPVLVINPAGFIDNTYASSMWNLPPWKASPVINGSFSLYKKDGPISSYNITLYSETLNIDAKNIMLLTDGFAIDEGSQFSLPLSRVAGLDYAVSNICAAMEADNVLLRKKGPLGVWSNDRPADSFQAYAPMRKDERDELQSELSKYGLKFNQFQQLISRSNIKYVSAGYNVKDLMTKETVRQGIETCCDKFNVPSEVMSFKDVTYANRAAAEQFMYQNNIIPGNMRDMRVYNDFFNLAANGLKLCCDFDDLPVLQEDASNAATAMNTKTDALGKQYRDGLITKNEYRQALGYDAVAGDDKYYNDQQDQHIAGAGG